jgi:alpha-galactosidase
LNKTETMMLFRHGVWALLFALCADANDNGLGRTPQMGWNSWNHFYCDIHEDLIQDIAQAAVDLGLKDAGYSYINLDDCWQISLDDDGYIQEDPDAFPSGIPALSDYVHSLGLKFGLYSDAGTNTCQKRPGSLGYETQDAERYKEWKIDYLKYDNCFSTVTDVKLRYQAMHDALNASGHPIFFSMCEWGVEDPATWASPVGNSWRTTGDIGPTWGSITNILDQNNQWHEYAGPGGWNDPDMLEVGNGKLTYAEQKSHFTLWCLMKAPLLLGNDLRQMGNSTLEIISNSEVIALNQDPLGVQGYKRTSDKDGLEVWAGPLSRGHVAVVLFNRSSRPANIIAMWNDIGIAPASLYHVRDLWARQDLGIQGASVTALVDSHDVVALRLKPVFGTE